MDQIKNLELEFIILYFLKDQKQIYKKNTYLNRELIVHKYIVGYLNKNLPLERIFAVENVIGFIDKINELELSDSRKNLILSTLKNLLDFCEEREYITPSILLKAKKVIKPIKKRNIRRNIQNYWDNEQYQQFINSIPIKDYQWSILFELTYWGALRLGEVLALTWNDIDYINKTVYINKAVDRDGVFSNPKNESSLATVDLPSFLIDKIQDYERSVHPKSKKEFIFFNGKIVSRTSVARYMKKFIRVSGVPYIKFHGLRHSMASRMINANLNPLIVSKHLRHASTQQTLDTYAHIFPKLTKGLMDKI